VSTSAETESVTKDSLQGSSRFRFT